MIDLGPQNGRVRPGDPSYGENKDIDESINAIDLGPIKFKALNPGSSVEWTREQVDALEDEYRKFWHLRLKNPASIIVPEALVDAFWHFHIIDTEKYAEDCISVFGEFMHHFPYFGLRSDEDFEQLSSAWQRTTQLYKDEFGEPPSGMWDVMADCGRLGCAPGPG